MCATSQPHLSPGIEISLRSCLAFPLTDLGKKSGTLPRAEVTIVPDGQTLLRASTAAGEERGRGGGPSGVDPV